MVRFVFGSVLILTTCYSYGQLRLANELFDNFEFEGAITNYELALQDNKLDDESFMKLAYCYLFTDDYIKAETAYKKIVQWNDIHYINYLFYGESLKNNHKFDSAKIQYNIYAKNDSLGFIGPLMAQSCDSLKDWISEEQLYTINNLDSVNSHVADFSPQLVNNSILFCSELLTDSIDKVQMLTLYEAELFQDKDQALQYGHSQRPIVSFNKANKIQLTDTTTWSKPSTSLTSKQFHYGPFSFNEKQNRIAFTVTKLMDLKGGDMPEIRTIFFGDFDTLTNKISYAQGFNWNSDSGNYSVAHPALNSTSSIMIFSSNMKGGFGGSDLYVTRWTNNGWEKPLNLGAGINTRGNEMFPYWHNDSLMYYSTDGRVGFGKLDIFEARLDNGVWSTTKNMKQPFNSTKDDFGLIFDEKSEVGYISSNRVGGKGDDDLYVLNSYKSLEEEIIEDYKVDELYVMPNIYYALNRFLLKKESKINLDTICDIMQKHPEISIEVYSHTDSKGTSKYNKVLSVNRANTVKRYMETKGIAEDRIIAIGYGEEKLLNKCSDGVSCTKEEHQQNRRTEFKIISGSE